MAKLNFSLTQLEYVLAVHKYGHFAKAAESQHITQPTLSMQIQKLEEELGVVIFDRSKKPILLTEAGKKIIDQIQTVLSDAKRIEEIIKADQSATLTGDLNVGVIPTIAPDLLPKLLPTIEKNFPQLNLLISELQTSRIVEALNSDEIDVGILATPLNEPQILEHALYYEPFRVLCQKDHELARHKRIKHSALKGDDIWLLTEGHCLRNQVLDICAIKQKPPRPSKLAVGTVRDVETKPRYHFESGSLETLKNLVRSYGGYTLLPEMSSEGLGGDTVLIEFERPIPAREVGLVFRRQHYKSHLIEALGDSVLECLPEKIRKIRPRDLEVVPI